MTRSLREVAAVTAVVIVAVQPHVHAYIDPGSTSMLLQGLIGGVAAVLVVTRSYWSRAANRLKRMSARPPEGTTSAGSIDRDEIPTNRPGD